jgi:uncharacterized protein
VDRPFAQNKPLTDAELNHLGDFLAKCKGGRAMNVEVLDGFFAALIAGPEAVMPSEYYREVFGGGIADTCVFASLDEANEIFGLLMRHWNDIAGRKSSTATSASLSRSILLSRNSPSGSMTGW